MQVLGSVKASLAQARQQEKSSQLLESCICADSEAVGRLLKNGADPNAFLPDRLFGATRSAMTIAVSNSDARSVELLLAYGADPDSRNDEAGSVLSLACEQGCIQIVRLLLLHHSATGTSDERGWTPLMFAVASLRLNPEIVLHLLQNGADVNAVANDGTTVLMAAARTGDPAIFRLLLNKGCRVNDKNKSGDTALAIAHKNDRREAEAMLLDTGSAVETPMLVGRS